MANKKWLFREVPPPKLEHVLTISQPQQELISEHWKNVVTALQWEFEPNSKIMCVMFKAKACLSLICFQSGCLLYQRKFKIAYGQVQEITCIAMHPILITQKLVKKKEIITGIGFYDGSVELYHLIVTSKSIVLKKMLSLDSKEKQAATNLVFERNQLIVCRLHQVQVYRECLTIIGNLLLNDGSASTLKQKQFKCSSWPLPLKSLGQGTALSLSMGKHAIHVYNESEGSKSYLKDSLQEYGTILDSITILKEIFQENLIIGDSNDKLKIIYKHKKLVERYYGFKNYCSDIVERVGQKWEELWVGDYNGCITFFERELNPKGEDKPNQFLKMVDLPIHFSVKICANGIKKLIVCGGMLTIFDTEGNIIFYDIASKERRNEGDAVEVEQLDELSEGQ